MKYEHCHLLDSTVDCRREIKKLTQDYSSDCFFLAFTEDLTSQEPFHPDSPVLVSERKHRETNNQHSF